MYPSEYAYHEDSVTSTESPRAKCMNYQEDHDLVNVHPEDYIHCDTNNNIIGIQPKLTDSNFGQAQYQPSDYHVWSRFSSGELLLFIFPTRVSLITITLHYYSDSVRGFPRLVLYAVPDDFDVWDTPRTSYPRVDFASVPPDGEPAGHRRISINVNFNTTKVLVFKYTNS